MQPFPRARIGMEIKKWGNRLSVFGPAFSVAFPFYPFPPSLDSSPQHSAHINKLIDKLTKAIGEFDFSLSRDWNFGA